MLLGITIRGNGSSANQNTTFYVSEVALVYLSYSIYSCAKMMEDYKLQCARESPYDHKTSLHTTPQSPTHTSQSTQHIPPPSQHQHSQGGWSSDLPNSVSII